MQKFNKHLIVVGSARSGTSWLSETLSQPYRYRMLFEPEHETRTKRGHLLCDQWIPHSINKPEAHAYLKRVFANRVDSDWIGQNSNRKFKRHLWPFIPKKYIIKFVRANLLAKYMNESFQIPVIHMIRDPYDVLHSQQRANFPWLKDLSRFVEQENLVTLIKDHYNFDIKNLESLTILQILTLRWCIENVIPLEVLEPYEHLSQIVRYEDLFGDINVFYKLCKDFDLEPMQDVEKIYRKPSTKTHTGSSIRRNEPKQLMYTQEEFKQINEILDTFQTQLYPRRY